MTTNQGRSICVRCGMCRRLIQKKRPLLVSRCKSFFLSSPVGGNRSSQLWSAGGGASILNTFVGLWHYFFFIFKHAILFASIHPRISRVRLSEFRTIHLSLIYPSPEIHKWVLLFICTVVRTTLLDFRYCFLLIK